MTRRGHYIGRYRRSNAAGGKQGRPNAGATTKWDRPGDRPAINDAEKAAWHGRKHGECPVCGLIVNAAVVDDNGNVTQLWHHRVGRGRNRWPCPGGGPQNEYIQGIDPKRLRRSTQPNPHGGRP